MMEAGINSLAHEPRCRSMPLCVAHRKILLQLLIAPRSDASGAVTGDVECSPSIGDGTAKFAAIVEPLCEFAGRVAVAAMGQCLGDIRATVPIRRTIYVRLVSTVRVVKERPRRQEPALIEREPQRALRHSVVHGREAEQIGLDRKSVVVAQMGKAVIGKGRVEVLALVVDALVNGVQEIRIAPVANSGLFVRCDVRRINRPEWEMEGVATRERPPALCRMAYCAICRDRKISPAGDRIDLAEISGRPGGIHSRIGGEGNAPAPGKVHRPGLVERPDGNAYPDGCKNSGDRPEAAGFHERAQTAHACLLPAKMSRSIGSFRSLIPVAAAIALQTAGGAAVVPVSPIPPGSSSFRIR